MRRLAHLYRQRPWSRVRPVDVLASHVILLGKGHWNAQDSLIHSPMDFTRQNSISLEDLQQIEQSVLFPRSIPKYKRFDLSADDYRFLYQYMSQYPAETNYPKYDSATYYDSYVKFFFKGEKIPSYIRVFNKVGWSYGFLTDVSLIVDFRHQVAFMLSCVVYVNSDGILTTIHMIIIQWVIHFSVRWEKRSINMNCTGLENTSLISVRFRIKYEHVEPGDKRPVIKDIAN